MGDGDTLYPEDKTRQEQLREALKRGKRRQLMKDVLYGTILGVTLSVVALYAVPKIIKNQFYSNQEQNLAKIEFASNKPEQNPTPTTQSSHICDKILENQKEMKLSLEEMRDRIRNLEFRSEIAEYDSEIRHSKLMSEIRYHAERAEFDRMCQAARLSEKKYPKINNPKLPDYPEPFVVGGVPNSILVVGSGNAAENLSFR